MTKSDEPDYCLTELVFLMFARSKMGTS